MLLQDISYEPLCSFLGYSLYFYFCFLFVELLFLFGSCSWFFFFFFIGISLVNLFSYVLGALRKTLTAHL